MVPTDKFKIEYWIPIALQPVPEDEDPLTYVRILKELWLGKLRGMMTLDSESDMLSMD
jgi:hypothetical protein